MIGKMDEKTFQTMSKAMRKLMDDHIKDATLADNTDMNFADNVNLLFPINTKEAIFDSAKAMIDMNMVKVYNATEQLYLFQRLLIAAHAIFEKEEEHTRLRDMLKGGTYQVDKIYTQEEMIVEATRLAELRVKELTDENAKDEKTQAEIDAAKRLAQEKEAEAKLNAEKLAEAEKKLADIEKQREAEAAERAEKEAIAATKAIADKRVAELAEGGFEVKSSDILFAYIKDISDETYSNFKIIVAEIVESAKKMMTPEEKKEALKMMDDKEKKKKTEASIVDDSLPLPKSISQANYDELDIAFANAFGETSGGDK